MPWSKLGYLGLAATLAVNCGTALAADPLGASGWSRFRGPNGSGVATDASQLPAEFSPSKNLQWRADLPGPGSSSPIVVGERILVTCWSGYGLTREEPGNLKDLTLHLIALDRATGSQLWKADVDAYQPEEAYRGMFAEHGYASHTPISDGERIYVFFGKSGVLAFDMDGKQLWRTSVGTGSDGRGWGSASSPVLFNDLVIITAAAESQALYGLNKLTGEIVWQQAAPSLAGTWGTPVLVRIDDQRTDLVLAVPGEVWGLNPETGKLHWYCAASQDDSYCSSVIAHEGIVYAIEGRSGGAFAIRAGGKGDVTDSHIVWKGTNRNRITSPVLVDGRIYYISSRVANCLDARSGQQIYQARMAARGAAGSDQVADNSPDSAAARPTASGGNPGGAGRNTQGGPGGGARPGGFGGGGFGGGGGRGPGGGGGGGGMRGQDYASPVVGDGKIYFAGRNGEIFVIKPGATYEQLAVNRLHTDAEDFSATPAIAGNQIFFRSSHAVYAVSQE
jgi:outer membrane protein assembly factor BamB